MLALLLLIAAGPNPADTPVTWTVNPDFYAQVLEVPQARDCRYWGARKNGDECVGYLVFASSPRKLRCHTDVRFDNVLVCRWKSPKAKP